MGFILSLVSVLGPFMWVVAGLMMLIAVVMFVGFMFYRKYPVRAVIFIKRAGRDPLMYFDRFGRSKKSGQEVYKSFFRKIIIEIPESKYFYHGKSFFNKVVIYLIEENGIYKPIDLIMGDSIAINPADKILYIQNQLLHSKVKTLHDTSDKGKMVKAVAIGIIVFIIVVGIIIFITKGKSLAGDAKDALGGIAACIPILLKRRK